MFLGIDLGTGSVKALVLDREGSTVAAAARRYEVLSPRPGWAEGAPRRWWQATAAAVRQVAECGPFDGIGLSGQMHGLVPLAADGTVLRPPILWPDTRTASQCAALRALPACLTDRLANPAVTGMALVSLMWLAEHEPQTLARPGHIVLPKDWLRLRLTGQVACDPSDASATLAYDIAADGWFGELLERLGLPPACLPPLQPSTAPAGSLTSAAAAALGLAAGTPVITGAADAAAALVGTGLVRPGPVQLIIGTGMQIIGVRAAPVRDPARATHLYRSAGDDWYASAAMQNGGLALEWVRARLGLDWDGFYEAAAAAPEGAEGLTFLPYLTGERTPLMDPGASAAWLGLALKHETSHMARAAFEGVACSLADGFDALSATGLHPDSLRLTGGGSVHPAWRRLLAALLGRPLDIVSCADASARGAAMLAAIGAGALETVAAAATWAPRIEGQVRAEASPALRAARDRYRDWRERMHGAAA